MKKRTKGEKKSTWLTGYGERSGWRREGRGEEEFVRLRVVSSFPQEIVEIERREMRAHAKSGVRTKKTERGEG